MTFGEGTTYLSTQFNHEEDYTYQKNNGSGGNRKEKLEKEQTNMRNHMAGVNNVVVRLGRLV